MPSTAALVAYVASFYRSSRTPPYSDRTLVKDASLALAASNPQNRLAVENAVMYTSPGMIAEMKMPKDESQMGYFESREDNKLIRDVSNRPGFAGVRSVTIQECDGTERLAVSLWWMGRAVSSTLPSPPPVSLRCRLLTDEVLDLRPLATATHLVACTWEHCRTLSTVLMPTVDMSRGLLHALTIHNCDALTRISHTTAGTDDVGEDCRYPCPKDVALFAELTKVEMFTRGGFDFTPFVAHCPLIESLSGFVPSDHAEKGLTALSGLSHLRVYSICSTPLASLKGLEKCTALEVCECRECFSLDDVSPLAGLPQLREVSMTMTCLTTIEPLLRCPRLEVLSVSSCESLNELPTFPAGCALRDLDISYTSLSDLTPLARCTNLETIHINNCTALRDLSPVVALPKLKTVDFEEGVALEVVPSFLFTDGMYLSDWMNAQRFAGDYSGLRSMTIHECGALESLSGLENATQLESVDLMRSPSLHDLSALSNKANLTKVDVDTCPVDSLEWARTCTALRSVSFSDVDALTDLTPLVEGASAPLLESLTLFSCPNVSAASLACVDRLTALSTFSCSCPALTSVDTFAKCQTLRVLRVGGGKSLKGSLAALSHLPFLETLDVSDSCITSVLPAVSVNAKDVCLFPSLKSLNIVRCVELKQLTEGSGFDSGVETDAVLVMPKLEELHAYMTSLVGIPELAGCGALRHLSMGSCAALKDLNTFFSRVLRRVDCGLPTPLDSLTFVDLADSGLTTFYRRLESEAEKDATALTACCKAHWTTLRWLDVSGCPLDGLSTTFVRALVEACQLEETDYKAGRFERPREQSPNKRARHGL